MPKIVRNSQFPGNLPIVIAMVIDLVSPCPCAIVVIVNTIDICVSIASSSSQVPLAGTLATVFDRQGKVFENNTIFCKSILALGHGAEEGNSRLERCWVFLRFGRR